MNHEHAEGGDDESSQNSAEELSDETLNEIEARLYSVIHYSDLTKPLDESISTHYNIEVNENAEIIVSFKDQLELEQNDEPQTDCNETTGDDQPKARNDELNEKETHSSTAHSTIRDSSENCCKEREKPSDKPDAKKESKNRLKKLKWREERKQQNRLPQTEFNKTTGNDQPNASNLIFDEFNEKETHSNGECSFTSQSTTRDSSEKNCCKGREIPPDKPDTEVISKRKLRKIKRKQEIKQRKLFVKRKGPKEHYDNFLMSLHNFNASKRADANRLFNKLNSASMSKEVKSLGGGVSSAGTDNSCAVIDITSEDDCEVVEVIDVNEYNASSLHCKSEEDLILNISIPTNSLSAENLNQNEEIEVHQGSSNEPSSLSGKQVARKSRLKTSDSKSKRKRKLLDICSPKKWSATMTKYYSRPSKRLSRFDHVALIREMREKASSSEWFLSKKDIYPPKSRGPRCENCRQFGHFRRTCPEPRKQIICYMCGGVGHLETRCPKKQCLTCGRPCPIYVQMCSTCHSQIADGCLMCSICGSYQHSKELCPNMWRAYHLTTTEGPIVVPYGGLSNRKHCSNCAGKGHYFHECRNSYSVTPYTFVVDDPVVYCYDAVADSFASLKSPYEFALSLQLSDEQNDILSTNDGEIFLQDLSNAQLVVLEIQNNNLTIKGSQAKYFQVRSALNTFIKSKMPNNISKRKR